MVSIAELSNTVELVRHTALDVGKRAAICEDVFDAGRYGCSALDIARQSRSEFRSALTRDV